MSKLNLCGRIFINGFINIESFSPNQHLNTLHEALCHFSRGPVVTGRFRLTDLQQFSVNFSLFNRRFKGKIENGELIKTYYDFNSSKAAV